MNCAYGAQYPLCGSSPTHRNCTGRKIVRPPTRNRPRRRMGSNGSMASISYRCIEAVYRLASGRKLGANADSRIRLLRDRAAGQDMYALISLSISCSSSIDRRDIRPRGLEGGRSKWNRQAGTSMGPQHVEQDVPWELDRGCLTRRGSVGLAS